MVTFTTASAAAKATTTNQFDPYQAQYSLTSYPRMENIGVTAPNSQIVAPPSAPPPYETVVGSSVPFPSLPQITAPRPRIIESRVPQPQPRQQPQTRPQSQPMPDDTTEAEGLIALGCCCTGVLCCCATGVMCCCTIL